MKVLSKQNSQYLLSNKQNIKTNQHSFRHRNDHSIQAKSPIKIPQLTLKRQDLTFRQHTCNSPSKYQQQEQQHDQKEEQQKLTYTAASLKLSKENRKFHLDLNFGNREREEEERERERRVWGQASQSQSQCQIVDSMWDLCNKLACIDNYYLRESVEKVRVEVAKMLAIVAHQNFNNQAPLASSKKTKLQNCIAISHCQKQIHHKEFQSQHEQQPSTPQSQQPLKSSQRTIKSQQIQQDSIRFQQSEQTPKLQMRKIMYMLQGKQKMQSSNVSGLSFNSAKRSCQRLSSLSSFNQNQCDDSGFTVFEIQRGTERLKSSTREAEKMRRSESKRQNESKVGRISQDLSQQSEDIVENNIQEPVCIGNKRKVLNDIVAMLNQKYNKNIKLQ